MAENIPIQFPLGGISETQAYNDSQKPTVNRPEKVLNVRPFDAIQRRARGGQRTGIERFIDEELDGGSSIRHMTSVVEAVPISTSASFGTEYSGSGVAANRDSPNVAVSSDAAIVVCSPETDALYYQQFDPVDGWGANSGELDTLPTFTNGGTVAFAPNDRLVLQGASGANRNFSISIFDDNASPVDFSSGYTSIEHDDDGDGLVIPTFHSTHNLAIVNGNALLELDWDDAVSSGSVPSESSLNMEGLPGTGFLFLDKYPDRIVELDPGDDEVILREFDPDTKTVGQSLSVVSLPDEISVDVQKVRVNQGGDILTSGDGGASDRIIYCDGETFTNSGTISGVQATSPSDGIPQVSSDGTLFYASDDLYAADLVGLTASNEVSHDATNDVETGSGCVTPFVYNEDNNIVFWADGNNQALRAVRFNTAQLTPSGRETKLIAFAGGNLYRSDSPPSTFSTVDGSTGIVSQSVRPATSALLQQLFICDGREDGYHYYDVLDDQVRDWVDDITAGELPTDPDGGGARIIATYRGRIVLAGLEAEPQNWFMSESGDPFNFDYFPETTSSTQPVAGSASDAGELADVITALIPFQDDVLIIGGINSIWLMRGDPAAGGQLDAVTRQIGIVGSRAWAYDESLILYFFGFNGLYRMSPGGGQPELVSGQRLAKTFEQIDLLNNEVQLVYDAVWQGVHVFICPPDQPDDADDAPDHYFWDRRTNSFWRDRYPAAIGPDSIHLFLGDSPSQRGVLVGGWDGYIRQFSEDASDDDGTAIESFARLPLIHPQMVWGQFQLQECQFTTEGEGNSLDVSIYRGKTPQQAIDSDTAIFTRTLQAGRNQPIRQRVRANALSFELGSAGSDTPWAFEAGNAIIQGVGRQRARSSE